MILPLPIVECSNVRHHPVSQVFSGWWHMFTNSKSITFACFSTLPPVLGLDLCVLHCRLKVSKRLSIWHAPACVWRKQHTSHIWRIYKNIMKISEIMNICFCAVSQLPFHEVDFSKLSKPNDILMIKNQSDSEGIQVQHVQQCLATHHHHRHYHYHHVFHILTRLRTVKNTS